MTLSVFIHPETESRVRDLAQQAGKDVAAYVSDLVEIAAAGQSMNGADSAVDLDRALEELFAGDTRKLPATPLNYSRQDIYVDHMSK